MTPPATAGAAVTRMRNSLTDEVRQGRIDLAAALRMSHILNFNESIGNHYSLAVGNDGTEFLMNPMGRHWAKLTAGDILLTNLEGKVLAGEGEIDPTAYFLHTAIHRMIPRARCVMHNHMRYATTLTSIDQGRIEMISQNAARFYGRVAYDDEFHGMALSHEEAERCASAFKEKGVAVLMMANHGVMVIGDSVAHAFDELYYLEKTCENQLSAMWTGKPLKPMSDKAARITCQQWQEYPKFSEQHFAEVKRILDADEPDYATQ